MLEYALYLNTAKCMNLLSDRIDQCLPQTQCGECGYNGCKPYAKAIAEQGEVITKCPPGGVTTLRALAALTGQDPKPLEAAAEAQLRPPQVAIIREPLCIGCTKCIQACPVDAIVGTGKKMHTIIADECTGCELCVPVCPTDCIDLTPIDDYHFNKDKARSRHQAKLDRQAAQQQQTRTRYAQKKSTEKQAKLDYIQAAMARVQAKKQQHHDARKT